MGLYGLNPGKRRAGYWILSVSLSMGVLVFAAIRIMGAAPYGLTYDLTRSLLLLDSGLASAIAQEGFFLEQSRIFYMTIVPLCLGAISVALATAFGAALSAPGGASSADWESDFNERGRQLQNSFLMSSLVLVTSTAALMLMIRLPVNLADGLHHDALTAFAFSLTMFWGTIMTCTLLVMYVPSLIALRHEACNYHRNIGIEENFGEWIGHHKYFSYRQQLSNLAALLTPVLVGPAGALIESWLNV